MAAHTNPSKLSEAEYVRLEGEKAKAAVSQHLEKAKQALVGKIDPGDLTRKHPWTALVAAAIAGFAAVVATVPSKHERELRRIEELRRATDPPEPAEPQTHHNNGEKPPEKPSLGVMILREVIAFIRPILLAAITTGIKAGINPPGPVDPDQPK